MLFTETVLPEALDLLKKIQSLEALAETRLVGGTALALQYGHRKSVDLDFFGKITVSMEELPLQMAEVAEIQLISASKSMCFLNANGIKVDIVNYPYDWITEPKREDGVTLAGVQDIAAMKLAAITNRGTKKDFIDFHFLLQHYSFQDLIGFYRQKYSDAEMFPVIKSLTYFEDAETDPMPVMLSPVKWEDVKHRINAAVSEFMKG